MQYQSRLLNATGISSGDIILQAELDSNMRSERASLGLLREAKEAAEADYAEKLREVQFRIDNICRSLSFDVPDKYYICYQFMQTIPFNDEPLSAGTAGNASTGSVVSGNINALEDPKYGYEDSPKMSFDSKSVLNSIFINLNLNDLQAQILQLHMHELLPIATLNVDIQTKYIPKFSKAATQLVSKCKRILFLRNSMINYRSFATEACELIWKQDYANTLQSEVTPPSVVAKAGAVTAADASADEATVRSNRKDSSDSPAENLGASQKDAQPHPLAPTSSQNVNPSTPAINPQTQNSTTYVLNGSGTQVEQSAGAKTGEELSAIRQRNFELVSQYLFYNTISFGLLQNILISPPDFIAFVLVALCGILGGLLKIILSVSHTGKAPTWRGLVTIMLLGMICALIFYSLFRGGYLAVSNADPKDAATNLNPFVIALLALASGLLSDRAISAFKEKTNLYFGDAADEPMDRWGFALKQAVDDFSQKMSKEELAKRCRVSVEKLEDWMQERDPVPPEAQERLSYLLYVPRRSLFTQDPPTDQIE
jgi:hypothetical protein